MQGTSYTCSLRSRINSTRVHTHIRLKLSDSPAYAGSHRRLGYALLAIKQLDHLFVTRGGQLSLYGKARQGVALSTVGHHIRIAASLREGLVLLARAR